MYISSLAWLAGDFLVESFEICHVRRLHELGFEVLDCHRLFSRGKPRYSLNDRCKFRLKLVWLWVIDLLDFCGFLGDYTSEHLPTSQCAENNLVFVFNAEVAVMLGRWRRVLGTDALEHFELEDLALKELSLFLRNLQRLCRRSIW